jgi:hypothetical protein
VAAALLAGSASAVRMVQAATRAKPRVLSELKSTSRHMVTQPDGEKMHIRTDYAIVIGNDIKTLWT